MTVMIRPLTPTDEARWRMLWAGYLDFYETSDLDPKITDHTWSMLSGPRDDVFALMAEQGGGVVGFVHGVAHANTWSDKPVCYLEDLFVDPSARGQGAGRALIEAVAAHAQAKGWGKVYWRTATDNATARALYDQLAAPIDFVTYERKVP